MSMTTMMMMMLIIIIIIIMMMMTMMMTTMITITTATTTTTTTMMIKTLKSVNRDIFTIYSLRPELSPTRTLKWQGRIVFKSRTNISGAYHVQRAVYHVVHVLCHVARRNSSATKYDRVQKMPHTKARKLKPQPRLEPEIQHWWQMLFRKADITPCVAPVM